MSLFFHLSGDLDEYQKDSPALKETRDMLETKLEDKKVRGILNWIFQIAVVLIFGILAGIALFQSVTVQESTMEPTLQVGERFFVNRAVYKVSSPERGDIIVYKTSGSDDAALHIGRVIGLRILPSHITRGEKTWQIFAHRIRIDTAHV